MIVYHGSVVTVENPDIKHSYRPLDFGKGFYVTSIREQAERWAKRKADLLGRDKAIINILRPDSLHYSKSNQSVAGVPVFSGGIGSE